MSNWKKSADHTIGPQPYPHIPDSVIPVIFGFLLTLWRDVPLIFRGSGGGENYNIAETLQAEKTYWEH